jgi:hypothetical protein
MQKLCKKQQNFMYNSGNPQGLIGIKKSPPFPAVFEIDWKFAHVPSQPKRLGVNL